MAKGGFLTFMAGVAAGAAIVYLSRTEKGEHILEKVETAGGKIMDASCNALVKGLNAIESSLDSDEEYENYLKAKKEQRDAEEE